MAPRLRRRAFLSSLGATAVAGCGSGSSEATFVAPRAVLIDEPLALEIHDLPGATEVEVTARTTVSWNDESRTWSASATFLSASDGTVSLHEIPPVEGAYDGVDPMGLFWAMTVESGENHFFPPRRHQVTLSADVGGETVAETTIDRLIAADGVTGRSLDGDLVGTLYTPPGEGPAPGVVLLHGSGGNPPTATARLLSSHGFVTLALRYFGPPDTLPDVLSAVPVEYVQRAIDRLLAHPRVAGPGVGLWGVSKGAELAAVVASHDQRVDTVVGLSPSSLVWEGFDAEGYPTGTSSWTRGGEPVPYLSYPDYETVPPGSDPFDHPRSFYEYSQLQAAPSEVAAAAIPVERIEGDVLLFSGTDDRLWHSTSMAESAIARLDAHDHPYRSDHRAFEGAGHAFQLPFLPTHGTSQGFGYPLGGAPEPNARASREHWPAAVDRFADLQEGFEPEPPPVEADGGEGSAGRDRALGYAGVVTTILVAGLVALGVRFSLRPGSPGAVDSGSDRAIESEVTRVGAVRYLQGSLGHAAGSTLFLWSGGLVWVLGSEMVAVVTVSVAFLLAANGLSIWAWDRLQTHFASRTEQRDSSRTLTASPLSVDSRVEMKAGAVMVLVFVGLLVAGRLGLQALGPRPFGYLCVACLLLGNAVALANAVRG